MEVATTIRVNGKDYCKLVDIEKVQKRRLDIMANAKAFLEAEREKFNGRVAEWQTLL